MATVEVTYTCGCGYSTTQVEAATNHSDKHQHTLTVLGVIKKAAQTS
jgi:hypothetical protein